MSKQVTSFHWKFDTNEYGILPASTPMVLREVLSWVAGDDEDDQALCEVAFHLTNAPIEYVDDEYLELIKDFRGPSLSVGDFVKVGERVYKCVSVGWEEVSMAAFNELRSKSITSRERWA